ncbi:hypothetical protein X777_12231, partial [Ooceraea biroi]
FPTNTERREKWFHSIGYTVNAYKNAKICSDHFTEDDYNYTGTSVQSKRLKKTAIPSVLIQRNECTMDIEHESRKDYQQSSDIQHDNIMAEATLVEKSDAAGQRYLHKLNMSKKSRARKKISTMQSVIQISQSKNLVTTDAVNALKLH